MPGFAALPEAEIEAVIDQMLSEDILWEDAGILGMGEAGERTYGWRHYMEVMSVFLTPPLFQVRYGRQELGVVDNSSFLPRSRGEPIVLSLGGRAWALRTVDWRRSIAYVEPTTDTGRTRWRGGGLGLGHDMCQRIRDLLASDDVRDCWSQRARQQLAQTRSEYPWITRDATTVLLEPDGELVWWTFAGSRTNASLVGGLHEQIEGRITHDNFAVKIETGCTMADLEPILARLRTTEPADLLPPIDADAITSLKFNNCLSRDLAQQMLQQRALDEQGLGKTLQLPVRFTVVGHERP